MMNLLKAALYDRSFKIKHCYCCLCSNYKAFISNKVGKKYTTVLSCMSLKEGAPVLMGKG